MRLGVGGSEANESGASGKSFEFMFICKIHVTPDRCICLGFNKKCFMFALEGSIGFYLFINVPLSWSRSPGLSLPWVENSRSTHPAVSGDGGDCARRGGEPD